MQDEKYPEWYDLTKYPTYDNVKYRAQDKSGSVFDYGEYYNIGNFPVVDEWKNSLISIDDLLEINHKTNTTKDILTDEEVEAIVNTLNYKPSGLKYDDGKPRFDLIPPLAEKALAEVLEFGARKYAPNNWKLVDDATARYTAALLRHVNAWRSGEIKDSESGLHHLAHAMTCISFLLEMELQNERSRDCAVS